MTIPEREYILAYAKHGNHADAYLQDHPKCSKKNAYMCGWHVYKNIVDRVGQQEVFEVMGLSDSLISNTLKKHINSPTEEVSLNATKFVAKLKGHVTDQSKVDMKHSGKVSWIEELRREVDEGKDEGGDGE
jgi:hypothetical protein